MKKGIVIKKDIQQLSEYVEHIKELFQNTNVWGILAGQQIENKLEYSLNLRGFVFKKYFKDIPLHLKLCDHCRKAVRNNQNKCKWCGSQEFLSL